MQEKLIAQAGGKCELCQKEMPLAVYEVLPALEVENKVVVCQSLIAQIEGESPLEPSEWRFLAESVWSEKPAVQVLSWRMLQRFKDEAWASEILDSVYLNEETMRWATALGEDAGDGSDDKVVHVDSNGNVLQEGDTVVLTRTLDVKGSSLNAKMGTVVKNIRLVENNPEQIEGKIGGQVIVILTKYLRKQ